VGGGGPCWVGAERFLWNVALVAKRSWSLSLNFFCKSTRGVVMGEEKLVPKSWRSLRSPRPLML